MPTLVRCRRVLRAHPYAVDIGIAALLYVVIMVSPAVNPHHQLGPLNRSMATLGAVMCATLVFRRRWPLQVLVITVLVSLAYFVLNQRAGPIVGGSVVALFTVSVTKPRRISLPVGLLCVLVLGAVGMAYARSSWLEPNLIVATWCGLAVAAGEATKNWRAYIAEIQERAQRAERTREQEATRRVTQERLRIARDLHDLVGHHIALINVQAGVARHVLDQQPAQAKEALAHIRQACRAALDELASTIGLLRQPDDSAAPTEPSVGLARLDELADSFGASGLRVDMAVEGTARAVPAAVDLTAYRVIQESLTNVRKHADTSMATVRLRYQHDSLCIVVEDEGSGSSTVDDPVTEHGHGIVGMGERAAAVGGTLHAGPRPGGGFQVQATLPTHAAALAS